MDTNVISVNTQEDQEEVKTAYKDFKRMQTILIKEPLISSLRRWKAMKNTADTQAESSQ